VILTVTPNAAVDKTFRIEGFSLDRVHRPSLTHTVAGGKGINVARVYQTLGGHTVCTGFLGGAQGSIVARALAAEKIANQFVPCQGETRLCIAVIDPTTGTQTEVNELGPEINMRAVSELLRRVQSLLLQQEFDFVVLSGSLPPGAPDNLYAELIRLANEHGVRAVLDSSGAALREGVAAKPWMVKPNRVELETLIGEPPGDATSCRTHAESLREGGIEVVVVTLGAEGAVVVTEQECVRASPPTVEFASAVASGDSFLAAFLWAWSYGSSPGSAEDALRLACAAGAANAAVIGAGFCSREAIMAGLSGVTIADCV
jgi:1-phosphofructokinase family hexose kinase